jgi:hypothetical protein
MEYLFSMVKHVLLISDKPKICGVHCPVRLEVSIFGNGSVYVAEKIELPVGPQILNHSYHKWDDFKLCFKEAADLIEKNDPTLRR